MAALEADRRRRVARQAAAADRARVVSRVDQQMVREAEQPLRERAVERPRHRVDGRVAVRVQVGPPRVADEQRVAGEHEPGLVAPGVVRHQVRVMRGRVTRRRDRLELGVAELDRVAVGERDVVEVHAGALGEVRGRAVRSTSSGSPETWSACTCVSSTATIGIPWPSAMRTYSSTRSACGSTTANRSFVLQPNTYEAHAESSFRTWRKNMLAKLSRVRLNSK